MIFAFEREKNIIRETGNEPRNISQDSTLFLSCYKAAQLVPQQITLVYILLVDSTFTPALLLCTLNSLYCLRVSIPGPPHQKRATEAAPKQGLPPCQSHPLLQLSYSNDVPINISGQIDEPRLFRGDQGPIHSPDEILRFSGNSEPSIINVIH